MNDVLHSTLCKTPSIFNLSSSTTNCSFPSTCTLKIWQDDRYGPHLPWTRIRASVERSKTASGISSMLPTHTRRLLQINTWGTSSSFVFRGPIMAKIDPASAPIFNIRSICARISPCPDNDIAPQLCNWRENISTINQPKGSDIGVESKPGKDLLRRHQNPRWIVIALSTHYEQDSWCNISLSEHWSTWSWLVWPEKWKHWSETNSHPVRRHISARLSFSSIELSSMG